VNRIQRVRRFRLAPLALTMAALLAVSIPAAVPALAAGSGTVQVDQTSPLPAGGPGATFQITVSSTSDVAVSGVQTSVAFDKSLFAITTVARPSGTDWGTAPQFIGPAGNLGVAANMTAAINSANGSGKLATVAATFSCDTQPCTLPTLPAGPHLFLTVTFRVLACPAAGGPTTSDVSLPIGAADSYLQDGAGDPVGIGATASKVSVQPCVGTTSNSTTHVTSTLDAGFISVEVPPTLTIPLLRQVNNTSILNVNVITDGTWTLNVSDSMPAGKLAADRGHMTDAIPATKRLALPMQAQASGGSLRTLDQPTANTNVATGSGSSSLPITLSQFVGSSDPGPASYTIVLTVTATSGF
jgi:hypothetical protein